MRRASTRIVMFLILFHGAFGYMAASGWAGDMGVDIQPAGGDEVEATNETAAGVDPGSGIGDTLFGMFTSLGRTAGTIFTFVFAGPLILESVGVPAEALVFIYSIATIVVFSDMVYAFSGRSI